MRGSLLTVQSYDPYTGLLAKNSPHSTQIEGLITAMSQTMKDKTLKTQQPVAESPEDLTAIEKWVDQLKPYGSMIALGIAICFLAFIGVTYWIQANQSLKEAEWRQLNISMTELGNSGNTSGLKQVAEEYPDGKAGLWALQMAGDYDLRTGISQLSYDRDGGLKLIEKAKEALQNVVDAPAVSKSTMLQRRSIFSLAYANESLGNFEAAKGLYQQIVEAAPDTAFAEPARRGIVRCSDPQYVVLFEKFKTFEDILGEAPGPTISSPPDISFPEIDAETTTGGGGEFGSTDDSGDTETESAPRPMEPMTSPILPNPIPDRSDEETTEGDASDDGN